MTLDFLSILPHGIGHTFEYIGMFTRMYSSHGDILEEWEGFYGECFIEILFLYVLFDEFVIDGLTVNISGTEEHSGCEVVFVIDDIHVVESNVFLFGFGLLVALKHNHLVTV